MPGQPKGALPSSAPSKAIATPIVSNTAQNGAPSPPSTTVPALPKPELPQAAVISPDAAAKESPAAAVPTTTATAIPAVKNAVDPSPIEAKDANVVPPRNVSMNPLTAIVMGKSAILTRQHKSRIRIKYSNLRNPALKSNNVLNEHNVRHLPARKKESTPNKKVDIPSKADATNENGKPIDAAKSAGDIKLTDDEHDDSNTDSKSALTSPASSSSVTRKAKKKTRKIAVNKNTKLHRSFDSGKDKLWACRHCGKRYRWKSTLRRHENDECGNKEPSHQCPYCEYKAKQRGNLGVHVRKHHADKPKLESSRKRRTVWGQAKHIGK